MKEIIKIEKFVSKVHNKYMNIPRKPKDTLVADLLFAANLLKMSIWNLKRWSTTTNKPKTAWVKMLNKIIKDVKGETNVK